VRARGYGAGRRARCRCVAERATALKARVLHARAWNVGLGHKSLLQCLWAELRHVSERFIRKGNYLTAVNRPMEEQM